MIKNLRNQWRVLDAGNYPELAATFRAGLDIDGEHPLEPLHPAHRGGRLIDIVAPGALRHDAGAVFEVGCKYSVETGQIQPRPGNQGRQAGDEVHRFQHDVGRSIPKRMFVAVHDPAPVIDAEALGGDRRPGDVTAQTFQA